MLTAVAALLTGVATLIGVLASSGLIGSKGPTASTDATHEAPNASSRTEAPGLGEPAAAARDPARRSEIPAGNTERVVDAAPGAAAATPPASGDCVATYLGQWPGAATLRAEVGGRDQRYPLERRVTAIRLEDDAALIGLIVVNPRQDGGFKVLAIRDSFCQPAGYFGNTNGGSAEFLSNYDSIIGIIGKHTYEIRLGQEGDKLEVNRLNRTD